MAGRAGSGSSRTSWRVVRSIRRGCSPRGTRWATNRPAVARSGLGCRAGWRKLVIQAEARGKIDSLNSGLCQNIARRSNAIPPRRFSPGPATEPIWRRRSRRIQFATGPGEAGCVAIESRCRGVNPRRLLALAFSALTFSLSPFPLPIGELSGHQGVLLLAFCLDRKECGYRSAEGSKSPSTNQASRRMPVFF